MSHIKPELEFGFCTCTSNFTSQVSKLGLPQKKTALTLPMIHVPNFISNRKCSRKNEQYQTNTAVDLFLIQWGYSHIQPGCISWINGNIQMFRVELNTEFSYIVFLCTCFSSQLQCVNVNYKCTIAMRESFLLHQMWSTHRFIHGKYSEHECMTCAQRHSSAYYQKTKW